MKGSIGQKSQIREVHPDAGSAVALARIDAHLGAYQFIETRLAGRMRADPGGFECYGKFSQINNARMRGETYCKIHIRVNRCGMRPDGLGSCHLVPV